MSWISVCGWRRFQHYDPSKRRPLWVKTYTDLTRSDDYLELTAGERALLHGIWLEYASAQCQLKFSASSMSRRLNLRVTRQQLERLVQAGFIEEVASKLLADGYQDASPEVEVEKEEPSLPPSTSTYTPDGRTEDAAPTEAELADIDRDDLGVPLHRNGRHHDEPHPADIPLPQLRDIPV